MDTRFSRRTTPAVPSTAGHHQPAGIRFLLLGLLLFGLLLYAANPGVCAWLAHTYAVMLTATVTKEPPAITISWPEDTTATKYEVYRKIGTSNSWSFCATLPGTATQFTDTPVNVETMYEYKVARMASVTGYGYICSGIELPAVDYRGKVILIVDSTYAAQLSTELSRLQNDLVGDGWHVIRHDVLRTTSPASIKALILDDYNADPLNVKHVFLFGHVPVVRSGYMCPDGHTNNHLGAWPADVYYGDMIGNWTDTIDWADDTNVNKNNPGDGLFDQNNIPATMKVGVGRVDMFDLPSFTKNEPELLRQYLNKDHDYRFKKLTAARRAFIDDNFGDFSGEAFAANGWRNFAQFVGMTNVAAGNWTEVDAEGYLWGYGCGGGNYVSCGGTITTAELAALDPKVIFCMLFGSYFGDWDSRDNLLRASLATSAGLTCSWAGRPHWYYHHMGMGYPIGYSATVTQNNSWGGLYVPQGTAPNYVHTNLLGDPTLRLDILEPPSDLSLEYQGKKGVRLGWKASSDANTGYNVYRIASDGAITRLNSAPVTTLSYFDTTAPTGLSTYMVRALALTVNASGSYYNLSQGIFGSTAVIPDPDMQIRRHDHQTYVGNDIYNTTGNNQTGQHSTDGTAPAIFAIKIENDGTGLATFNVTGPSGENGWTVKYYDALTSGTDITAEMTGEGWSTGELTAGAAREIRMEVVAGAIVQPRASLDLYVTATLGTATDKSDVVKATITRSLVIRPAFTEIVSIATDGTQGDNKSVNPAITHDGRYVVFESLASTLAPGDANGKYDIFLRDRQTDTTTRLSLPQAGGEADGDSTKPVISADGQLIAFQSDATNLTADDTNGMSDIFVIDQQAGTLLRITDGDGDSTSPALSADGTCVAFVSTAANLVPNDTNGKADIFVYNLQTQVLTRVSQGTNGNEADGDSASPALDSTGRYVYFSSLATNLVTGDTNDSSDIFRYDTLGQVTTRLSVNSAGSQGDDGSYSPRASADGRFVAFYSRARNLMANDTNGREDVFVRDLQAGTTTRVSIASDGTQANSASGLYGVAISADGTFIAFQSSARNLLAEDTNGKGDIFLHNRLTGQTERVSIANDGSEGNGDSVNPALNGDGTLTAFASLANNLVDNDTNGAYDVFVHQTGQAFQPDAQIKTPAAVDYIGDNLYRLGDAQTAEQQVTTGALGSYDIKIQNDASLPDSFVLTGTASADGWTVTYLDSTSNNITDAVTTDGWLTPELDPGTFITIKVTLKTYASLPTRGAKELLLTATSVSDATRADTVRALTTLKPLPTIRASIATNGTQGDGLSRDPSFSADGRFAVFESAATTFIANDANGSTKDVFIHDRETGITTLISRSSDGTQGNGESMDPDISGDGRFVTFKSLANNLVPGLTYPSGKYQIYLFDRETSTMSLISLGQDGTPGNDASGSAVISTDGNFVAFATSSTNIVEGVTGGSQIYRRDLTTNTTMLVSRSTSGLPSGGGCDSAAINADGSVITFRSSATNLVPDDTNGKEDVFAYDATTATIERVNVASDGTQSDNSAGVGSGTYGTRSPVSGDGRYVTFVSLATNLVANDTNGKTDIFVHDRQTKETIRVSVDGSKAQNPSNSDNPSISVNGRYIAFDTDAALLAEDTNGKLDVYVYDMEDGSIARMSYTYDNKQSGGDCFDPFISADGRYVSFESSSSDLVPDDTNGKNDIFVRDRWSLQPDLLIRNIGETEYAGQTIINLTGDQQTKAQIVLPGGTATYEMKVINDGSEADHCIITGSASTQGWTVAYFDEAGTDITADVTGEGWGKDTLLNPGDFVTCKVTVTADVQLPGGASNGVRVTATSAANATAQDRVIATTQTVPTRRPDMQIRATADAVYLGDNVYNNIDEQTKTEAVTNNVTAVYHLKIENDGGGADNFIVTGEASTLEGWTVRYFDAINGGNDITDEITSPQGWDCGTLEMGDSVEIRLEVTPGKTVPGNSFLPIQITAALANDPATFDTVKAETIIGEHRQLDLQIKSFGVTDFTGDDIYNTTARFQEVTRTIGKGSSAFYMITVQNDGNVTDSFTLVGPTGTDDWSVQYYDAPSGGTNITGLITTTGWTSPSLAMNGAMRIRVEIKPNTTVVPASTFEVLLLGNSTSDPKRKDAVKMINIAAKYQPDLLIANKGETVYLGEDIYNVIPPQTCAQTVDNSAVATYLVQLQNDGNIVDRYTVTGPAGDASWQIRYFDAATGGNDITAAVTGGGWLSPVVNPQGTIVLRVEVTPGAKVLGTTKKTVRLTARSSSADVRDAVEMVTTVRVHHQLDELIKNADDAAYIGDNIVNNLLPQTRGQSVRESIKAIYFFKVENEGNVTDNIAISGPAGDTGWTIRYFDVQTNREVTSNVTATGGMTVAIPAFSAREYRLEVTANKSSSGTVRYTLVRAMLAGDSTVTDTVRAVTLAIGDLIRISTDNLGQQALTASDSPSITADGRYVAFVSTASNLVADDTNGLADIFVHDKQTGETFRVSLGLNNTQPNGASAGPVISADGRYIAFWSAASNLVAGDTNQQNDVFVYDRETKVTRRVSVSTAGAQANANSGAYGIAISADGRFIAFDSAATNLVAGDSNAVTDIFLRDMVQSTTVRVSINNAGAQANGASEYPSMTPDGRYITYGSQATNLVDGDTNGYSDVFLYDTQAKTTMLVNVTPNNVQGNGNSDDPAISADGRYIAFTTYASNLVAGDTNKSWDILLRDLQTGAIERISSNDAQQQANGFCFGPEISADGRYVAFRSLATNLVPGDTNGAWDVFVRDRQWATTVRTSIANDGTQGNADSGYYGIALSANGRYIAFQSLATNLVGNDTNNRGDVFERDLTMVMLTTDPPTARINTTVTLAALTNYAGNAEYQFRVGYQVGTTWTWTTLQDYSPASTCLWTPTEARKYTVVVYLREAGSQQPYVAYKSLYYTVTASPVTTVSLQTDPKSPSPAGVPISLAATSTGGVKVQYQFRAGYQVNGVWTWTVIRDYSAAPTCIWTPTEAHTYTLAVWARSEGSEKQYEAYASTWYNILASL